MASLALVFDVLTRDNASQGFKKIGDSAERAGRQTSAFGSLTSKAMASAAGAITGLALGSLFTGFIQDARESAKISRLTEAAIKSTGGAANITAQQVNTLATALSNKTAIDDEAIQSASNLLLTFTRVRNEAGRGNDIFDQATAGVLDMSSAMGTDANSAAITLGKALNDPIKGLTALGRAGVQFTEQQKEQIRTFVEAGDVLSAQKIILAELGTQFGGAAEAAADPLSRLGVVAGNLGEEIGGFLLPAVEVFADFVVEDLIPAFRDIAAVGAEVVGFIADIPGPILAGVAAMGGFVLLRGPLTAAFDTIALRTLYLKDSLSSLSGVGAAARTGLGRFVSFLGGPWGLAIGGAAIGLGYLVNELFSADEATEGATSAQRSFADALRESKGVIDETVRAQAAKAALDADLLDLADAAGIRLGRVTDAVLGNEAAYRQVTSALDDYLQARLDAVNGNTEDAGFVAASDAVAQYKANLDELAPTVSQTTQEQRQLAEATSGTGDASAGATGSVRDYAAELEASAEAAGEAKRQTDSFKLSLDILTGASVSMIEVQAAFEATLAEVEGALDDMSGSVLTGAGSLDLQSEAGRAAADVLLDVRNAGNDLIATMISQGATADAVRQADAELRASFIDTARQMGIGEAAAGDLADAILGVPDERNTQINTDVQQAMANVDALQTNIDNTRGKDITIGVRAAGRFIVNPQGGLQEFWKGGFTGDGGMFDVRGLVHAGEYVFSKAQTDRLGVDFLESLANSGMPGYAGGGFVPLNLTHDTRPIEAVMEQVASAIADATPKAGVPGAGATGSSWSSLWDFVRARVPAARINSTYRPGDPGYHGRGKAIDFGYGSGPGGAGSAGLAQINRVLHDGLGSNLAELIYDGLGDDRPDLKNGRPLTYSASTQAQHRNHVHAAVYDAGGLLPPGLTLAYNGTGRAETVRTAADEAALHGPIDLSEATIDRLAVAMMRGAGAAVGARESAQARALSSRPR